jgi:uncharacterized protein
MSDPEHYSDATADPPVRGYLHRPEDANGDALVLSHGAGSNAQAPLLVALANKFASAGFVVLRCDLPSRQTRPYGPPGPGDAARDRKGLKNAVAVARKIATRHVFLGGHSYGGRQSTMLCAEEPDLADGLLLLSYPLHPPRKPEQLRTQHLPNLRTPSLFIEGTRDPFGSIEEMEAAIGLVPARTQMLRVEGAGHDLNVKKSSGGEVTNEVVLAFQQFFGEMR